MPRNKRKSGRGRGGGGQSGGRKRGTERTPKNEVTRYNEKYCRYYDSLNLVPEYERDAFWTAMKRDLPNSFRFAGSKAHALAVQQRLKDYYIPEIISIKHEGSFVEAPRPINWYPDELAWYMTVPKTVIRRFAPFASFQKFLVAENDVGNISRQEVVSMIPPLLMDIGPGMTVLDLCAAPGSKSAQLLEMVLAGEEESIKAAAISVQNDQKTYTSEDDGRSTGLLIANDVDYKRAHMLVHQLKRLSSANLIVTNHDATMFPSIKLPSDLNPEGKIMPNKYLKFDRILADVPCSGDGTSRKNLEIWRTWTPQNALGLHTVQTRILVRALQMLKAGGRVVYSTCSMNPIEDEAVLVAAIDRCGGPEKVRLVDCSNDLPGLSRYPGLNSWSVMDRNGEMWQTYADVETRRKQKDDVAINKLTETMFPPTDSDLKALPLHYAMRIYPHSQDTGAFFIAVLEKISEIRARPEHESRKIVPAATTDAESNQANLDAVQQNGQPAAASVSLEGMIPVKTAYTTEETVNADKVPGLREQLVANLGDKASPKFKREAGEMEEESKKRPKIEQEAKDNDGTAWLKHPLPSKPPMMSGDSVATNGHPETTESSFIAGQLQHPLPGKPPLPVKKKKDQPFEEPFKYVSPDIPELEQIRRFYNISDRFPMDRFMVRNVEGKATKNIYYTTKLARDILRENEGKGLKFVHSGVKMFVKQDVPNPEICPWRIQTDGLMLLERWVDNERVVTLRKRETLRKLLIEMFPKFAGDGWKDLGEVGRQILSLKLGCCVLRIEPGEEDDELKEYMVFPLWKSLHSLNLMLPKEDRRALLLRLFNDSTPLVNPMKATLPRLDSQKGAGDFFSEFVPREEGASLLDALEQEIEKDVEAVPGDTVDADGNTSSDDV